MKGIFFLICSLFGVVLLTPARLSAQLTKVNPSTTILQLSHISCYGDENGLIEVGIDSENELEDLEWLRNGEVIGTSPLISDLSQGLYHLRYNTSNKDKVEQVFRIRAPRPLTFEYEIKSMSGQDLYQVELIPIGGEAPYRFFDEKGRRFNSDSLSSGIYTAMVRDANGCSFSQSILVGGLDESKAIAQSVNKIKCHGDGNGTVKISQNESEHVIWADGKNEGRRTGLSKGVYTYTRSNLDFDLEQKVWIEEAAPITVVIKDSNDLINPGLEVLISGGTGEHSFVWNDGLKSKKRNVHYSGLYRFLVVDQNGCKVEAMVDVEIDPFMGFLDTRFMIKH